MKVSLSPSHASTIQSSSRSNIPPMKRTKMSKDCALFVKGKPKGDVNFPPFDRLDEEGLRDMERFKISPLGAIWNYARHIPYNSEKKIFMDKTGRESFEGILRLLQYRPCPLNLIQSSNTFSAYPTRIESIRSFGTTTTGLFVSLHFSNAANTQRSRAFHRRCFSSLTSPDYPSKDAQCESRTQGHYTQHHWWIAGGTRLVTKTLQ